MAPRAAPVQCFCSDTGTYFVKPSSPSDVPPRPIASPCVKVCIVDGGSGLCLGCKRTLTEIADWSRLTDARRAQIMAQLETRELPF